MHRLWEPSKETKKPSTPYSAKFSVPYCVAVGFLRKDAGLEFSKVLDQNKRTRSLILNTISRDKYIEDNKRGFINPISSRNLDNDVEDEVVKALADAVTGRFKDLSHRYYKLKSKWFNMDKLNWWDRNAPLPNKPNQKCCP